jgi:hypothetical protein
MIVIKFDPTSRKIMYCRKTKELPQGNFLEVSEFRDNWDVTHEVSVGLTALVPVSTTILNQLALDEAAVQNRVNRDAILISEFDRVYTNSFLWGALTTGEQEDMLAFRLALLDVPQQTDQLNIVWPVNPLQTV